MLQKVINLIRREPALVVTVAAAVIELAASFGFNLTDRQTSAATALLTVLSGAVIRSQVSPA